MPSLSRILLPIDFSGRSLGAARYAKALAECFGSEIALLHVLTPPHYELSVLEDGAAVLGELHAARARKARLDLDACLTAELAGLSLKRVLLDGDPAREIVEFAHRESAGLVIMPTHGYGPFRRFILGSVTAKILHDADLPVLTGVHLEEKGPDPDPISFRRILAAVDLGPASARTFEWAAWLATALGAGLSLVHVTPCVESHLGEDSDPGWKRRLEEEARERVSRLAAGTGGCPEILIESGDAPGAVCAVAGRLAADLLVIGRGSAAGMFGRLRTNAYAIVRQSPCPVVSV